MANEFVIKNGYISQGNSYVNATLSANTVQILTTPTLNNSNTQVLSRNSSTGSIEYLVLSAATSSMITSSITTSAATLNIDTNYYGVNYNGNVDILLPNPSGYDGYNINIKDESGNAGIYRIRLTPLSGLIDGNNYVDMNINYMSLHVVARNNNWWII